ncbi:MAG: asparagine synthase (glutamine-hydrolyzing) [Phycisphaerae bacterium]|nr:asparagine synthase (glutamine-hydrolyzing) [Phycisphaerae bacterium]
MCGIAGILVEPASKPPAIEKLHRMVAMLRHRGPDGYGLYQDRRVGLAHARLSIIDLVSGAQPIHNEDESVWVILNGEVFNYLELRRELEALGHRFYTQSDTEVIVHAYEQYGQQAWVRFNGQFAFALWDNRSHCLWLVRDRLGIIPLHYTRVRDRLLFASEVKALFASGDLEPEVDADGIAQVFTGWAACAPCTVFKNVFSVRAGAALCFRGDLEAVQTVYWRPDLAEDARLALMKPDDAADLLEARLRDAVSLRLRADVPVGAYLSGGLDSSVIGHFVRQANENSLQTFAIRFDDPAFDETPHQRRMAALLGTRHHEIICHARDISEALPEVVWHCETPLLRTAPAPLFLLSKLVRDNGMKVVMTGEGADELFAGYDIFKEDRIRRFWARQPDSQWRPLLLSRLYPDVGGERQRQTGMWRQFFGQDLAQVHDPFYSHRIRWRNSAWTMAVLSPDIRRDVAPDRWRAQLEDALPDGWRAWPTLSRAQAVEIASFMTPYLLCSQGDRVAMSHGVEVRYPFLDPDLVKLAFGLPSRLKLRGMQDKVLLRRVAGRHLPPEIGQRPKKPYRAPMTEAFFGPAAPDYVEELLSPSALTRLGLAAPTAARKLVDKARRQNGRMSAEREEMALIGLLSLQLLGHFFLEAFGAEATAAYRRLEQVRPDVCVVRAPAPQPAEPRPSERGS